MRIKTNTNGVAGAFSHGLNVFVWCSGLS